MEEIELTEYIIALEIENNSLKNQLLEVRKHYQDIWTENTNLKKEIGTLKAELQAVQAMHEADQRAVENRDVKIILQAERIKELEKQLSNSINCPLCGLPRSICMCRGR